MMQIPRGQTGTAIAVLAPVANEEQANLTDIVQAIADAATWWAWPHMVSQRGRAPSIDFSFSAESDPIQALDPTTHPVLKHYVAAYTRALGVLNKGARSTTAWPWTVKELRSERPDKRLGGLAYRRVPTRQKEAIKPPTEPDVSSHVALLRNPRMVVKYWEVAPDPHGQMTVGVFVADPDLDAQFALSEPVAHDEWIPANLQLKKFERNPVKNALDRLRLEFRSEQRSIDNPEGATRFGGITRLASSMGDLLQGHLGGNDARLNAFGSSGANSATGSSRADGTGSGTSGRSGGRRRTAAIRLTGEPALFLLDGEPVAEFWLEVAQPATQRLRLTAVPRVVLDGGVPEQPGDEPVGAPSPKVLGWKSESGAFLSRGPDVELQDAGNHTLRVLVQQPADTAVTIQVRASEPR